MSKCFVANTSSRSRRSHCARIAATTAVIWLLISSLTTPPGAAGTAGTLEWPHFLRVHVENTRADSRIIIDSGWAGIRWGSQVGINPGDYLIRLDQSGYVRSLDGKATFARVGPTDRKDLAVYVQFPGRDGADAFTFAPGTQLRPTGTYFAGGRGNDVLDVAPYVPRFPLPMEFEITVGSICRAGQYLQVAPEWTRTVWRTPDGIGPGTYRVRLNADFTVTSPDGSANWSQIPARPEDWDHPILGVLIVHSCDPAGDGADIVGFGRNSDGSLQHMTTWAQQPDAGYGWLPFNSIAGSFPRPEGFYGGNAIVQVPVGSPRSGAPPPPALPPPLPRGSLPTLQGDIPIMGDWDGNGTVTAGVFRRGVWYLRNHNDGGAAEAAFSWGIAADLPVVGDWDGNGTDTIGVFRNGNWYLRNTAGSGGVDAAFSWGSPGEIPVVGDWDGNGTDTIGVFRSGTWHLRNTNSSGGVDAKIGWGSAAQLPVVGDWDGNGTDTIGTFENGTWRLRNSNSPGGIDATIAWGWPGDIPVVGDWDASRTTTIGVRRASAFYLRNSNSPGDIDLAFGWGQATTA